MANKIEVTIIDNSEMTLRQKQKAVAKALEVCGGMAESFAKLQCPVDTGNLRNSINHAQTEDMAIVGTNVEYAPYVEYGTVNMKAQPYLKPAITENTDEYKQIIETFLKD